MPMISTRPVVIVVFPVAESPTTPTMIGRGVRSSPLFRLVEARNLSARNARGHWPRG